MGHRAFLFDTAAAHVDKMISTVAVAGEQDVVPALDEAPAAIPFLGLASCAPGRVRQPLTRDQT